MLLLQPHRIVRSRAEITKIRRISHTPWCMSACGPPPPVGSLIYVISLPRPKMMHKMAEFDSSLSSASDRYGVPRLAGSRKNHRCISKDLIYLKKTLWSSYARTKYDLCEARCARLQRSDAVARNRIAKTTRQLVSTYYIAAIRDSARLVRTYRLSPSIMLRPRCIYEYSRRSARTRQIIVIKYDLCVCNHHHYAERLNIMCKNDRVRKARKNIPLDAIWGKTKRDSYNVCGTNWKMKYI